MEYTMETAREEMDKVLVFLRNQRKIVTDHKYPGARELSEAITLFETGCMWMIRSQFASEGEYSPKTKLKKVE